MLVRNGAQRNQDGTMSVRIASTVKLRPKGTPGEVREEPATPKEPDAADTRANAKRGH